VSETLRFDLLANDRASHVFNKVGDSADRTTDRFKSFAKVGALAAAAGAVMVGKALVDMTKAAMEDEAAQKVLATSMRNAAGASGAQVAATERWISAQGKALGVADDELRPAMARLVQATGDVKKSQELAGLAMDVSAGTGKSLKSVTDALAKAQTGSLGGLAKMGVATKDASGEAKSLGEVTKELANIHGGQAATAAETASGKFQRLKVMFDESKESIGSKLIPIASDLATLFIDKVVPAAQKLGDWLRDKLGPPLADLAERIGPAARRIMSALKDAFEDARPFIDLVGTILGNVVVPAMKKMLEVAGPILAQAIRNLGKSLEFVGEAGVWMWNNALQPAFKFLVQAIGWVLDGFSSMLDALSNVPGFGWAKDAAASMGKAAEKAQAVADGINKIPDKKVTVTVAYVYKGKDPTRSGQGTGGTDSFMPRMGDVETASFKLGQLLPEGFKGGMKSKVRVALEAVNELVSRAGDKLQTLKDKAADIMSGVASAMQGSLDLGNLGGTDSEGNRLNATDQLAAFAGQSRDFAQALATAAANGVNSGLIGRIANMGPGQGLTAAQALAAMDQAQVASANASLAAVDAYATQLGNTVITTTSLPDDIARAQGQLTTLQEIRDDLKNNPRNINFTVNDATDPDKVVAAIRRYVNRNGKLRGLTKDD
jgi:hypothetical protein